MNTFNSRRKKTLSMLSHMRDWPIATASSDRQSSGTVPSYEVAPKAKPAALKALELDGTLAEAQTSLATVQFNYDWDWSGAATGFRRSIELNPSYATAYQRYSLVSDCHGPH